MTRDLSRLLRPRSLAVIGGGAWAAQVVLQARKMGFAAPIWPVHPTRLEVGGEPAVASLEALPGVPDAVWIGVNRQATVEVVAALAARGAGGAVCFASGFAEAGAEDAGAGALQQALVAAAGDMPVLGPNCYGFINALDGVCLWPDQHGARPCDRGVAVLTQSSNIAINLTMQARGVPLAYMVTCGNQAQTGMAALGMALLDDPRVTALGLHIEGVGDLAAFGALARAARAAGKPIVALKVGRSDAARAAAVSHTASLAGSDAGGRALLRRLGIGQVGTLAGFLEALKLVHATGGLASGALVSASCSGGEASLVADHVEGRALRFPPLERLQREGLRAALGPMVALANPLDYHTYVWGDVARMTSAFAALPGPETALALVICDFPRADLCDGAAWDCVIAAVGAARARTEVPYAIVATLPEGLSEARIAEIEATGAIALCGLPEALEAIEAAVRLPLSEGAILMPGTPRDPVVLSEHAAKAALREVGIEVPKGGRAADPEAAGAVARDIGGTLVLKGEGAAHKSEAGLVRLGLAPEDVAGAARAMGAAGFLVEEQVSGAVAELLVGVLRDPAHGFVLTLGAGGVWTELMADTASLLLPVTADEVRAALRGLRIAPLLSGYRGAPAADIEAIVAAVLALQDYVTAHAGTVEEVEINPLLCTPMRAVAADALIRKETT